MKKVFGSLKKLSYICLLITNKNQHYDKKFLVLIAAAAAPTEILINKIEESIQEWKIYKDEERFRTVMFDAHLLLLKGITNGNQDGAERVMRDMEKLGKYKDMFQDKEN